MNHALTRPLAALAALAVVLLAATPAGALVDLPDLGEVLSPTQATAGIDAHEVAAAKMAHTVTVTVHHPSSLPLPTAKTIDSVLVVAPPGLARAVSAAGPDSSWHADLLDDRRVAFRGGEIEPGGSGTFTIVTDILRPAADETGRWQVRTSMDGGTSPVTAAEASPGALDMTVRVLAVQRLRLDADATSVTAGQQGVTVNGELVNSGSGTLAVEAVLAGNGVTVAPDPLAVEVPPGTAVPVVFSADFPATTGDLTLALGATAPGADASPVELKVVVKEPLSVAYDGGLTPTRVAPRGAVTFALDVDVDGEVDVKLAGTTLRFDGAGIEAALATPLTMEAGAATKRLTFETFTVPEDAAGGIATGVLHVVGTDEHGAPIDLEVPLDDSIVVDTDVPVVNAEFAPPPSRTGGDGAATDGAELTFGGTVEDDGVACGWCRVTGELVQRDDDGQPVGESIPVALDVDDDGNLSGSHTIERYGAGATEVQLVVVATDDADRQSDEIASPPVPVDNTAPVVASFTTGGADPTSPDVEAVVARFSEPVVVLNPRGEPVQPLPVDFSCEGHTIVGAVHVDDHVELALAAPLGPDETPTCAYHPAVLRFVDRVGLAAPDARMTARDGIAPPAPSVGSVDGQGALGGTFYTNRTAPTLVVGGVAGGYRVEVRHDVDGDDDPLVGEAEASGTTVPVTLTDFGSVERTLVLTVETIDAAGNAGAPTTVVVTFDLTAPTLTSASQPSGAATVVVSVSELVRAGHDRPFDWALVAADGSDVFVDAVSRAPDGAGDHTEITLTLDRAVPVASVAYDPGPASVRYADRAGNVVGDRILSVL